MTTNTLDISLLNKDQSHLPTSQTDSQETVAGPLGLHMSGPEGSDHSTQSFVFPNTVQGMRALAQVVPGSDSQSLELSEEGQAPSSDAQMMLENHTQSLEFRMSTQALAAIITYGEQDHGESVLPLDGRSPEHRGEEYVRPPWSDGEGAVAGQEKPDEQGGDGQHCNDGQEVDSDGQDHKNGQEEGADGEPPTSQADARLFYEEPGGCSEDAWAEYSLKERYFIVPLGFGCNDAVSADDRLNCMHYLEECCIRVTESFPIRPSFSEAYKTGRLCGFHKHWKGGGGVAIDSESQESTDEKLRNSMLAMVGLVFTLECDWDVQVHVFYRVNAFYQYLVQYKKEITLDNTDDEAKSLFPFVILKVHYDTSMKELHLTVFPHTHMDRLIAFVENQMDANDINFSTPRAFWGKVHDVVYALITAKNAKRFKGGEESRQLFVMEIAPHFQKMTLCENTGPGRAIHKTQSNFFKVMYIGPYCGPLMFKFLRSLLETTHAPPGVARKEQVSPEGDAPKKKSKKQTPLWERILKKLNLRMKKKPGQLTNQDVIKFWSEGLPAEGTCLLGVPGVPDFFEMYLLGIMQQLQEMNCSSSSRDLIMELVSKRLDEIHQHRCAPPSNGSLYFKDLSGICADHVRRQALLVNAKHFKLDPNQGGRYFRTAIDEFKCARALVNPEMFARIDAQKGIDNLVAQATKSMQVDQVEQATFNEIKQWITMMIQRNGRTAEVLSAVAATAAAAAGADASAAAAAGADAAAAAAAPAPADAAEAAAAGADAAAAAAAPAAPATAAPVVTIFAETSADSEEAKEKLALRIVYNYFSTKHTSCDTETFLWRLRLCMSLHVNYNSRLFMIEVHNFQVFELVVALTEMEAGIRPVENDMESKCYNVLDKILQTYIEQRMRYVALDDVLLRELIDLNKQLSAALKAPSKAKKGNRRQF